MARRVIDPASATASPAIGDLHAVGGMGHGTIPQRQLIPLLVRMKRTLWERSFRGNIGKIIGTGLGVLYGIGGLVGLAVTLGAAALLIDGAGPDAFGLLMRGLGALLVLAWLVFPLLAFGLDDTLDPRRFAALPRTARELQPGLFAAATISLPFLFSALGVVIASVCEVLWLVTAAPSGPVQLIVAGVAMLPANLLGLALCMLLPRAIIAQSATRQGSRRGRELGGIVTMVCMIGASYGFSLLMQSFDGADLDRYIGLVRTVVGVAAWTPFAAPFSVPVDIAEGHLLAALVRLLIAIAATVLVWRWWGRSVEIALRSALIGDAAAGTAKVTSLVPRLAPHNALGAVIGRSLRYWRRDSRYLATIGVMPLLAIFFTAMGMISPDQAPMAVGGVIVVSGLTSMSIANELGFDGPAGWVNLVAGLRARTNLLGRVIAMAVIVVPFSLVAAVVVPLLVGFANLIPLVVLGCLGAMMGAWGVSCLVAVLLPFPTAQPGTNPLKDRSSGSANAMIASFAAMLGMWVPQIPAIILGIWGIVAGSLVIQLLAGLVSVVCGALALWLCLSIASRILERTYVDVFQKVRAFI